MAVIMQLPLTAMLYVCASSSRWSIAKSIAISIAILFQPSIAIAIAILFASIANNPASRLEVSLVQL